MQCFTIKSMESEKTIPTYEMQPSKIIRREIFFNEGEHLGKFTYLGHNLIAIDCYKPEPCIKILNTETLDITIVNESPRRAYYCLLNQDTLVIWPHNYETQSPDTLRLYDLQNIDNPTYFDAITLHEESKYIQSICFLGNNTIYVETDSHYHIINLALQECATSKKHSFLAGFSKPYYRPSNGLVEDRRATLSATRYLNIYNPEAIIAATSPLQKRIKEIHTPYRDYERSGYDYIPDHNLTVFTYSEPNTIQLIFFDQNNVDYRSKPRYGIKVLTTYWQMNPEEFSIKTNVGFNYSPGFEYRLSYENRNIILFPKEMTWEDEVEENMKRLPPILIFDLEEILSHLN